MEKLSRAQYSEWLRSAEVLEKDGHGAKVLRLKDGTFLKLFRRKSLISKSLLFPPAKRFANNAAKLKLVGIPCPTVLNLYFMKEPYRWAVHYEPLAGKTVRDILAENHSPAHQQVVIQRLAVFITHLHDVGVYFRSLHFGNIVLTPDNKFGLIDISDMRLLGRPLPQGMRRRNYVHLQRYKEDWSLIAPSIEKALLIKELR